MAVTEKTVSLTDVALAEIQQHLAATALDGWLLYDFRGCNPIAGGVLGLPALSRRYLVFIPVAGAPVALTHVIEQGPWEGWIGENRPYLSWETFEEGIEAILSPGSRIALEHSEGDAVPYLDRIPGGMMELILRRGVTAVSSGDLVSAFYSRWSEAGYASHRRAALILRDVAREAFDVIGASIRADRDVDEWKVRQFVTGELTRRGLGDGVDAVVAVNANAANPHYTPRLYHSTAIRRGDTVLIDLWGKEDAAAIYADQTWMGFVGRDVPARIQEIWGTIRDARDAAVSFIRDRHERGEVVAGFEVDDVVRGVIEHRGHGPAFIHRTGHSIDRELHGSGPNIDNLETRDTRNLIHGVGFSIEPGIYYPGEVGMRTEIDVFMEAAGPVVTTPDPQSALYLID